MPGKRGQVRSQAQWRWMWAAKKPFAKRWADSRKRKYGKSADYRSLPARKGARKHA